MDTSLMYLVKQYITIRPCNRRQECKQLIQIVQNDSWETPGIAKSSRIPRISLDFFQGLGDC